MRLTAYTCSFMVMNREEDETTSKISHFSDGRYFKAQGLNKDGTLIQCTPLLMEKVGVTPSVILRFTVCTQVTVQVRKPMVRVTRSPK